MSKGDVFKVKPSDDKSYCPCPGCGVPLLRPVYCGNTALCKCGKAFKYEWHDKRHPINRPPWESKRNVERAEYTLTLIIDFGKKDQSDGKRIKTETVCGK